MSYLMCNTVKISLKQTPYKNEIGSRAWKNHKSFQLLFQMTSFWNNKFFGKKKISQIIFLIIINVISIVCN